MRSPAANQRRRSRRLRNRQQPQTPPNQEPQVERPSLLLTPKLKYENSRRNADGIFVVSSRKRAPPTAEEIAAKKQKKLDIKIKQVKLIALRHEVVALWNFGMHTTNLQFGPKNSRAIAQYLQELLFIVQ